MTLTPSISVFDRLPVLLDLCRVGGSDPEPTAACLHPHPDQCGFQVRGQPVPAQDSVPHLFGMDIEYCTALGSFYCFEELFVGMSIFVHIVSSHFMFLRFGF